MDRVAAHDGGSSPRPSAMRFFVGRDRELTHLLAAMDDAANGTGSQFLLTGEPGIGKTRLLAELGGLARRRGFCAVSGRCWEEGGAPPYWPWIQALRTLGADLEHLASTSGVARSGAPGSVMPETERLRLFDEVARFVAGAASVTQPLLITLDDIHAADEASLLLLRYIGDTIGDACVLVVASYRDGERRVRELGTLFADLARVGRRLALHGLTSTEIGDYVLAVTGCAPTPHLAARLHEITGGNPFFVDEVVRLLEAGSGWIAADKTKDPLLRMPEEVRAVVRRRVATLPVEAVNVLRTAAVLGREFDVHVLQRASRLSPGRLLELLGDATAVGVVAEVSQSRRRYAFAHEVTRETLYDDLPAGRRLELHRSVGDLLQTAYEHDLDPHLSEIARHLYLAAPLGDADTALDFLVRAGDRAARLFAYEEAAMHYRQAVELLAETSRVPAVRRAELRLRLGDAQWRSGNGAAARETFEEGIQESRRLGDGEMLARAALGYVTALGGFLLYARFEVGGTGVGLLVEALAALPPGDTSLRAQLLAHLALEMWSGSEPVEERVAVSGQALEMARRVGDSEALVTALHARHWALTTPGMTLERLAHTEEMLRVAKETINPEIEFLAHNARFHCFLELCDRRGMEAESQAMTALAERLRQPFYRWHTVCLRTLRATLDGRFADAERLAEEALELGRLRQSEYATYVYRYAQVLAIRWAQGRLVDLWPDIANHSDRYPWIPRWRDSLAAAELDDTEMARRELLRYSGRDFTDLPRDGLWLLHASALAEAAVCVGDTEHARRLYELLLPHAEDNAVSYTQQPFGPVAMRLGMIASVLGRWQDADRHFAAALARCELLGARAIRARVLLEQAKALAARGEPADKARGNAALDEAERLSDELTLTGLRSRIAAVREASDPTLAAEFRRDGDLWTITYEGKTFRLRDVKGLGYIATLLKSPGREVHALHLLGGGSARQDSLDAGRAAEELDGVEWGGSQTVLDATAKGQYRRRLVNLEQELAQAHEWHDVEREARLEEEMDFLARELSHALGLGGRDRGFTSADERARVSVTKAIKTAIKLIERQCPELAAHLEASVHTGGFCSYATQGAAPPDWSV